ncbi:MAG: vWA domain-containing protein [Kofleriaceae bacterium]
MKTTLARFLLISCLASCKSGSGADIDLPSEEALSVRANAADPEAMDETEDTRAAAAEGSEGTMGSDRAEGHIRVTRENAMEHIGSIGVPSSHDSRSQFGLGRNTFAPIGSGRYATIGTGHGYSGRGVRGRAVRGHVDDTNTERYDHKEANAWTSTAKDRLSTFAADVDTASYAFVRRRLLDGTLPPEDAVRVEEMVNYFHYAYPAPAANAPAPFSVTTDIAPSPFDAKRHILRVGVSTEPQAISDRRAANLVFLVDVSGSMNGPDRLELAKRSLRILVDTLKQGDSVALVTYAGSTRLVLPATGIEHRTEIMAAIDDLSASGSTAMGDGIVLAYREAEKGLVNNAISRVIVLSDGDANVGRTGHQEMLAMVAGKVKEGVTLSTIGFGVGNFQAARMEQLANQGNGNSFYVDSLAEAKRIFQKQVGATLEVVAKDVKLQVDFDPERVKRYRLVGYENRDVADTDFRDDKVDAGEIGPGHQVTAIYEVELAETTGSLGTVRVRHKTTKGIEATEAAYPIASDPSRTFAMAPADLRFAFAVAAFGDVMRGAKEAEGWRLEVIRLMAFAAAGLDQERGELVQLVDTAIALRQNS